MEYIINPEETAQVKPCISKCVKNFCRQVYYIIAPCPSFGSI